MVTSIIIADAHPQPAVAANNASVTINKTVTGAGVPNQVMPGALLSYQIEFAARDGDADGPVIVTDALPEEFAGWEISGLSAVYQGSETGLTINLPGVANDSSHGAVNPASGVLSEDPDELNMTVGVALPVYPGIGNTSATGLPTGGVGLIRYVLKVPENMSSDDPRLGSALVNRAVINAKAGRTDISSQSSSSVTLINPPAPELEVAKTWDPEVQGFEPGLTSTVALSVTQNAAIPVSRIQIQDPSDPALTPAGATALPAGNPFNKVTFTGFAAPNDPTTLPSGVDSVDVQVYAFDGTVWDWVSWSNAILSEDIAGVRIAYESADNDLPVDEALSQSFTVVQRSTDRSTDANLSEGWKVDNVLAVSATTPADHTYTASASASFEAIAERVDVLADKKFYALPDGAESSALTAGAGDSVGVVIRATNRPAPFSTTIDALRIVEPVAASGVSPHYFSENLQFGGFNASNPSALWPAGATNVTVTWKLAAGADDIVLQAARPSALPQPTDLSVVTGFEITFTGEIELGAVSEIRYTIDSSDSTSFVPNGGTSGAMLNRVSVTGEEENHSPATRTADARLTLTAPSVTVGLNKILGPQTVVPGEKVFVQLDSSLTASGANVKSTKIVVEDSIEQAPAGQTNLFWNAFNLTKILAPIPQPQSGGGTSVAADLTIEYRVNGAWTVLDTNPPSNVDITIPDSENVTGVRFVYTNDSGLSQVTYVKPNLEFEARSLLRGTQDPTSDSFEDLQLYTNYAKVEAEAKVGDREIPVRPATDSERAGIRGDYPTPPVTGSGAWAAKSWASSALTTQSDVTTTSNQSWAIVDPGFTSAELQDPAAPTASGEGTVFEAFNLTHVRPILISGNASNGATVDPRLKWDLVSNVELWNGTAWVPVANIPTGGWMNTGNLGFKGYALTAAEQESTLGVKITLIENGPARAAAIASGDRAAPAVGSGVASSVDVRTYNLGWQLRNTARIASAQPGDDPVWVIGANEYNCPNPSEDPGCVENTALVSGFGNGTTKTDSAEAEINLIDGRPNVGASKTVQAINPATGTPYGPVMTGSNALPLTLPNTEDGISPDDFPQARFTISGRNTSTSDAPGTGKIARIRLTDSVLPDSVGALPPFDAFQGRDFIAEANDGTTPFGKLNISRVSFGSLPSYIDTTESRLVAWVWTPGNGSTPGSATSQTFTIQQVLSGDPAYLDLLQADRIVGVSATFSGADTFQNGNVIPTNVVFSMYVDVQLRATDRVTGEPLQTNPNLIPNFGAVGGWDVALDPDFEDPEFRPAATAEAQIKLEEPEISVAASKYISVLHGTTRNKILYEADPQAPVDVALYAEPDGTSAPIDSLVIEDQSSDFWEKFELVAVGAEELPLDANVAVVEVKVGSNWVAYQSFAGDLSTVVGVRATFTREGANTFFPDGSASWSTSWRSASLPFTVQLREGADVDWNNGTLSNEVRATASQSELGSVEDDAQDTIRFEIGTHVLRVEKHAPGDQGTDPTHPVDPLAYLSWELVFKNTGTSLLPITEVTDILPPTLGWDRLTPAFTSTAGINNMKGLTTDSALIDVTYDSQTREISFVWPEGERMYPNETMVITLQLQMAPTQQGVQSVNTVVVGTGVDLARCDIATDRGQTQPPGLEPDECGSQNFVTTKPGTFIRTEKGVSGESVETLGENLVDGAIDLASGEVCTLPQLPYFSEEFVRFPCVSLTTLGATDTWNIKNVNVGSEPFNRVVVVDMLPRPGDQTLGGGNSRETTFRPVLVGQTLADVFSISGLPSGGIANLSVTTNPAACIGATPNQSLWNDDPTCSDTATNPANEWVAASAYTGELEDIAGYRFDFDLSVTPLNPTEVIGIEFNTVNKPGDGEDVNNEKIVAELSRFQNENQLVWNQAGIVAWNLMDERTLTPLAPESAGVLVATGDLVLSKEILGEGAEFAPDTFIIDLTCTVPTGNPAEERTAFDLGSYAQVSVPANGSTTVTNIPIGANCIAEESGEYGSYGEAGRSIRSTPGVIPATDGLSAEVRIRDRSETVVQFVNTYTVSGITIEKSVLSTNEIPVTDEQRTGTYEFEVTCVAPGTGETVVRQVSVQGGQQQSVTALPDNGTCQVTETRAGGAQTTLITIDGVQSTGVTSDEFELNEEGTFVLVTNEFVGKKLETTGAAQSGGLFAILAIVLLGTGALVIYSTRRKQKAER